ncbi:MAG: leucyl aminopeptidase [Silvanigrellaceae bacterium]|nr:leucyl aminopeptidase [Silvanigrellaceae bacterium]
MTLPKIRHVEINQIDNFASHTPHDLTVIIIDENDLQKGQIVSPELQTLDKNFSGTLSTLASFDDFQGKWLQSSLSLSPDQTQTKRIVVVGAGTKTNYLPARARQLGLKTAEISMSIKAKNVVIQFVSSVFNKPELMAQAAIGFNLGIYKYPNSHLSAEALQEIETPVTLDFVTTAPEFKQKLKDIAILNNSINLQRLLQDGPPNIVTPQYVAQNMTEQAKSLGIKTDVMGAEQLKHLGFGAMLAVAGGSTHEPQFVVFEYAPAQYNKTIAFVGKGLTMDTGGYSIKTPSTSQEGMKYDMSGAAVALSSVLAIAKLKLPVKVFGVAALCENMIDAKSYRVGDVVTSYSGKTIEILNTDAEGRVVLSDALSYTEKNLKPDYIVEYSTLTGAIITQFGYVGAGVFAFDDHLGQVIEQAGHETGERLYLLPTWEEIAEDLKSPLADICNIGQTRGSAGSMIAAAFLKEFVSQTPFAHIDIAGVANANQAIGYPRKISSGYGVQLSVKIAQILAKI